MSVCSNTTLYPSNTHSLDAIVTGVAVVDESVRSLGWLSPQFSFRLERYKPPFAIGHGSLSNLTR